MHPFGLLLLLLLLHLFGHFDLAREQQLFVSHLRAKGVEARAEECCVPDGGDVPDKR
jgi:hypothetical protein